MCTLFDLQLPFGARVDKFIIGENTFIYLACKEKTLLPVEVKQVPVTRCTTA